MEEIIELIKSGIIDEYVLKQYIIRYIATQEDVIPYIMEILEEERKQKKELLQEMNLNLTRNTLYIKNPELTMGNGKKGQEKFLLEETHNFYKKYQNKVKTTGIHIWNDLP